MEGSQSIIDSIISDAATYAEQVRLRAQKAADKTVSDAKAETDAFLAQKGQETQKECAAVIANKRTLINLETKKLKLKAKRDVMDKVYSRAVEILESSDKKTYLALIEALVNKNAEDGDTLVFANNVPFGIKDVENLDAVKSKKLHIKGGGDFGGGIVLEGKHFDKRLTFAALVEDLRRETESELSEKLF